MADHYGNEDEALRQFYVLLDEFRLDEKRPNSRNIVYRLLHLAMLDFRAEDEHSRQKQIADLLHHLSNQLKDTSRHGYSFEYDNILEHIFERSFDNKYLHNWIKTNAPTTQKYEYELWYGFDGDSHITTLIPNSHHQKANVIGPCEKLIKTFFTMNIEKAKEIKDAFMAGIDVTSSHL